MKPQVREHALRSIVAALLGSGLPANDIREAAELLISDPDFAARFTAMVDAVLGQLPPPKTARRPARSSGAASRASLPAGDRGDVDEVLRILEPFQLTKKELVTQLQSHPTLADWQPKPHWSRRQIIESVVREVPRSQLPDVLAAVTVGRGPVDPWMEALATRGRKGKGH